MHCFYKDDSESNSHLTIYIFHFYYRSFVGTNLLAWAMLAVGNSNEESLKNYSLKNYSSKLVYEHENKAL
jgi:hypothetical protein